MLDIISPFLFSVSEVNIDLYCYETLSPSEDDEVDEGFFDQEVTMASK